MASIIEIRKSLGLSQRELADKLGVTQCVISRFERGLREPDIRTIYACRFLLLNHIVKSDPALLKMVGGKDAEVIDEDGI